MLELFSDRILAASVGLFGGVLLGLAARLGRFCTLGAIEDYLYGDSDTRLRMWGVAIGVAVLGVFALVGLGALSPNETIYHQIAWNPLASIAGGLLFGYGMALAGNCGFGALARLGGGDLRSFVIVLVMGISAAMTLSGPLAYLRVWAFPQRIAETGDTTGFAQLFSEMSGISQVPFGLAAGAVIVAIMLASPAFRRNGPSVFWGALVGVAVVSGWAGTAWIAHTGFDGLPVVSHTYASPLGESIFYLMTASGGGLSFAVGSVGGVLLGAFLGSMIKGHFRWEACEDPRELKRQILGAVAMGVGAVIAFGCTIGQGVSAFSTLAFSAPVTFAAIFAGVALGLRQLIHGFAFSR